MRTCCTVRYRQGHTSDVITSTQWQLSADFSISVSHPEAREVVQLSTALKAQMCIQHRAPAQGNSYMDHLLLNMQWSSGLALVSIQARYYRVQLWQKYYFVSCGSQKKGVATMTL